ncbi:MAG TPA: histidine kinase, partial [Flavisolibacter sp.]|nr:histidine kinase [Flavisolibacter sp.]
MGVPWQKTIDRPYIDTFVDNFNRPNKVYYRSSYLLYDGYLSDGDSLSFLLRKGKEQPFLKIHFTKRSALESPPQLMGYKDNHDPELPLEKFVQKALESYLAWNKEFYEDWPGRNDRSNVKLFPDTKTAYYFNPRGNTSHDSAFECRLLVDDAIPQWKKSNNIIFVSGLKAGKQYQLQVRQTDKPQYVFTKRFYVPDNRYQTLWFKLLVVFLLLLASVTLYLLIKTRQQKRIQEEGKSKMKSLYAQLNPHFIFNAMGSIQGLLNENELEKANRYLAGFGHLL